MPGVGPCEWPLEKPDREWRTVAFVAHRFARGGEHDLAVPPGIQESLDAQRRAAPARWPISDLGIAGDDSDFFREALRLIADHRSLGVARARASTPTNLFLW